MGSYHIVAFHTIAFLGKVLTDFLVGKCLNSTTGCLKNKSTYLLVVSFTIPISFSLFFTKFEIDNLEERFVLYFAFLLILGVSISVLGFIQLVLVQDMAISNKDGINLHTYTTIFQNIGYFVGDFIKYNPKRGLRPDSITGNLRRRSSSKRGDQVIRLRYVRFPLFIFDCSLLCIENI